MAAENKVVVANEEFVLDEDGELASGSSDTSPGHLVEYYGNDDYSLNTTTVQESPEVRVARKAGEIGGVVDGSDDNDVYTSGDWIKVGRLLPGVEVTLRIASGTDLGASAEANISEGDRLVTAGGATGGCVKAYDSANDAADAVFAIAAEDANNSGAATGVEMLVTAEVL